MPVIYEVSCDYSTEGSRAFPTLAAAIEHRRRVGGNGIEGRITKITTPDDMPIRELLCAMYNREGYSAKSEHVKDAPPDRGDELTVSDIYR